MMTIWGVVVTIGRNRWLLGRLIIRGLGMRRFGLCIGSLIRLVIRCLGTRRICLCIGSLILVSHWRVVAVIRTIIFVLKTQTSHLSLNIFNHFSALDVPCHYKIIALLLYICDCILLSKEIAYYY